MNINKGFISLGILLAIILGVVVIGGGAYYAAQNQTTLMLPPQEQATTTPATTETSKTTTTVTTTSTPGAPTLVVHGSYWLRAAPKLTYLGFLLPATGTTGTLHDVTQLFFNDESSKPGNLTEPSGSSFAAIVGDLRPRASCDLEIEATVEIQNPIFEERSGENIGDYRVVFGDFVRVVKRGAVTDICQVDNGHGGTTSERTPRTI